MTVVSYCIPSKKPVCFKGEVHGKIDTRLSGKENDIMPYDRFFIPKGHNKPFCDIMDIKSETSHRIKAFQRLGEHLSKKQVE